MEFSTKIGKAEVIKKGDELKLRDSYTEDTYIVEKDSTIELVPVPPLHVPTKITKYLYLKLRKPLVISKEREFWIKVPYELAVLVNSTLIKILSPFIVKHILHGDIVDGIICRYYETEVLENMLDNGIEALTKITFSKVASAGIYDYIIIPVENAYIYESNGKYYFSTVKVEKTSTGIYGHLTKKPPISNVKLVKKIPLAKGVK